MAIKRFSQEPEGAPTDQTRHTKRQKVEASAKTGPKNPSLKVETIESARQLQNLLTFHQGSVPALRNGIHSFKLFLESILYPADEGDQVGRQLSILREYLQTQRPKDETDAHGVFMPHLFQALAFAAETQNDHLFSALVAVLALLLKTLSSRLDFRDFGLALGRTVLQVPHAKLLGRGLSAPRHKEYVISPCLRLLTEVVSLDGGALARQVYAKRDYTFEVKIMARNLGLRHTGAEEDEAQRRKPSVRSNAVRYLLAHLKFQAEGGKVDILKQGVVMRALFDYIRDDHPQLATDILETVKTHVILDSEVPRASKTYLLTDRTLAHIASLYKAEPVEQSKDATERFKPIDEVAHDFLLLVCTRPGLGVLAPSSGWYPPGTEREADHADAAAEHEDPDRDAIDLGLDSVEWYHGFRERVPVRNGTLAAFAQHMRPYASLKEQELLLAIFDACPELVADYWCRKATFGFEPKLTATWIGYAAVVYGSVALPVPNHLGAKGSAWRDVPPPLAVVLENLLPRPLTQKVLTRCLHQSADLITFFALRILVVALGKLRDVLRVFREAETATGSPLWAEAGRRLLAEFGTRCPRVRDVIAVFRNVAGAEGKWMQREAATRVLALYHEVAPALALEERFEVAVPLTGALSAVVGVETGALSADEREWRMLELGHLLRVARHSPGMNWWGTPKGLRHSPFATLVRLLAGGEVAVGSTTAEAIWGLLLGIVREQGFFWEGEKGLRALVGSLAAVGEGEEAVWGLVDECIGRCVRRGIKYEDDLEVLAGNQKGEKNVSRFVMVVREQWVHAVKKEGKESVVRWVGGFLYLLKVAGENEEVLEKVVEEMKGVAGDTEVKSALKKAWRGEGVVVPEELQRRDEALEKEKNNVSKEEDAKQEEDDLADVDLEIPPVEDTRHTGLTRWMNKEADEVVEEGHAGALVLCLCSRDASIRRQALVNIRKLVATVENSTYEEWQQVDLLLGELLETARTHAVADADRPLPYLAGTFAARALAVLADPTHFLYPKLNAFLNRGPGWRVARLPGYWAEKVFLNPPEELDGWHKEVGWVLEWWLDGLRSPADLELLRQRGVLERVLALYEAPCSGTRVRGLVERLLMRAVSVGGGRTLVTRFGVVSWIGVMLHRGVGDRRVLRRLLRRLVEEGEREVVERWSAGGVGRAVEGLVKV